MHVAGIRVAAEGHGCVFPSTTFTSHPSWKDPSHSTEAGWGLSADWGSGRTRRGLTSSPHRCCVIDSVAGCHRVLEP